MQEIISLILTSLLSAVISFYIGWELQKRSTDRPFLRNEIYSPLHEEIKTMHSNISNFGSADEIILPIKRYVGVRNYLIQAGKYNLIPEILRKQVDNFYKKCEEYNKLLIDSGTVITNIYRIEIRKLKTQNDQIMQEQNKGGPMLSLDFLLKGILPNPMPVSSDNKRIFFGKYGGQNSTITKYDLDSNSISLKEFLERLIKLVDDEETIVKLRRLQQQIITESPYLLKELEQRISNPNPLFRNLADKCQLLPKKLKKG